MFDQFLNNGQSNNAGKTDPLPFQTPWMPAAVPRVAREERKKERKEGEKEVRADYKAVLN